jgi:hypothetical protein
MMDPVPTTNRRRRTIRGIACIVFVVGFVLLYLQSHNAKNRHSAARDSVKANALRYMDVVGSALKSGPVTGQQMLDMRVAVYRDGGGLAQGIDHVGVYTTQRSVILTFSVRVNFKGSFGTAVNSSSCFGKYLQRSAPLPTDTPATMDCAKLFPDIAPSAVVTLP